MPHLDRMPHGPPLDLLRQQRQEAAKSSGSNFFVAMNCQIIGPSLSPSSITPELKKRSTDSPGLGQHPAVGREARPLDREDEVVRRLVAPLREALGLLRAVVGAVDLDRGQLAARVFELALLGQALGVEAAAPGLEDPAADADPRPARSQQAARGEVAHQRRGAEGPFRRLGREADRVDQRPEARARRWSRRRRAGG